MKRVKNIPELRFPGFEGEWIEKKTIQVFTIFNGYAFSSNDGKDSGCRWIKIADVGINFINNESPSFLPHSYLFKYPKFVLRQGDYVVALTRPILNGKLKIAKIDENADKSLLNQRVGKLVSRNNLEFIYQLLQKSELIIKIDNRIAGSDPPNLSPNEIDSIRLYIPSQPEQQKIASFLSSADQRIQVLTQKKDKLEQYKKGIMQQIFSQQLRFKDEYGQEYPEWEEKRLGEISEIFKGKGISKDDISSEGKIECIRYGELYTSYNETITNVISKTNCRHKDLIFSKKLDVIMPASGETQIDIARASCVMKDGVALGSDLNIIRSSINGVYLAYFLNGPLKYEIAKAAQGISVIHLYGSQLKGLKIKLPLKQEQKKIASFLSSIDQKITLVNQQIELTRKWKQGLLQKMFL